MSKARDEAEKWWTESGGQKQIEGLQMGPIVRFALIDTFEAGFRRAAELAVKVAEDCPKASVTCNKRIRRELLEE